MDLACRCTLRADNVEGHTGWEGPSLHFFLQAFGCSQSYFTLLGDDYRCTVGDRKSSLTWNTRSLSFDETFVNLRDHRGVLVAHLRGNINSNHEIQKMLQGFPPFYREKVVLKHGPFLPHPIRDRHQTRWLDHRCWVIGHCSINMVHPSQPSRRLLIAQA